MTYSTNGSAPLKRPWPFDSHETSERRPTFHTPSYTPSSRETSYAFGEYDTTDSINWKQDLQVPASLSDGWDTSGRVSQDGNGQTATDQHDFPSSEIVNVDYPNLSNNEMEFQNSYLTRKDFQGPEQTFYDMTTHCQSGGLAGSSMESLNRSTWNTQDAAQVFIPLDYPSLAFAQTVAQPRFLGAPSNGGLTMNYDMSEPPNLDVYNPDGWYWNGTGDENQSLLFEPIENPLQTPVRASSEASPTSHKIPPQALAYIEEVSELTSTVCFGTICDISVRLLDDPLKKSDPSSIPSEEQNIRKLAIVKRDHYYTVQCMTDTDIGVIDTKTTKALQGLDQIDSVTYEAIADAKNLDRCIKVWKKKAKAIDGNIEINIYGPQISKEKVGKLLSAARRYLQQPRWLASGVPVDNPHTISFPNLAIKHEIVQLPTPLSKTERSSAPSKRVLYEVLEGLDQVEHLKPIDIDSRITTRLLNHQRKGVDFLLQRESPILQPVFSLWEASEAQEYSDLYQHKITGRRKPKPIEDVCGGILADEMGLGKTLMMLSAVLATLSHSYIFRETFCAYGNSYKRPSGATLVIAPSALLLDGWIAEVQRHVGSNKLRVHKYHGSRKETDSTKLAGFDIVLTTYATIAAECPSQGRLHGIVWFRIVLDEAHTIRNQTTTFFHAVASLSAKIRWCLTGTPIQNQLEDLGALVRFLRVPFVSTSQEFKRNFVQPIEAGSSRGFENLRTLLKCICIRRTKDLLRLPDHQVVQYELQLSPAEKSRYSQILASHKKAIDDTVCGKKTSEAYRTIFQALLKLRMLCNHGSFQTDDQDGAEKTLAILQEGTASCAYCSEDVISDGAKEDSVAGQLPACSHIVCQGCIWRYEEDLERLSEGIEVACPLCKVPLKEDLERSESRSAVFNPQASIPEDGTSTKLSKLLEDIKEHGFTEKSIIFSSWKKTLQIISMLLSNQNIRFVQLDGSVPLSDRRERLSAFQKDSQTSVLLMTLGTGAVGLNLTVATRIHIVEPQWNPSIESQAIGRAIRLGQQKQVTVIRYVMQNTVEQIIQSRQTHKLQLAELGFDAADEEPEEDGLKKSMDLRELLGI